jgi:hypothetical protein
MQNGISLRVQQSARLRCPLRRSVELEERRGDVGTEDPPKPGRGNVSRAATVHSSGGTIRVSE